MAGLGISLDNLGRDSSVGGESLQPTSRMVFVLCAPDWYRASAEHEWKTCWACFCRISIGCQFCKLWTVVKPGDVRRP